MNPTCVPFMPMCPSYPTPTHPRAQTQLRTRIGSGLTQWLRGVRHVRASTPQHMGWNPYQDDDVLCCDAVLCRGLAIGRSQSYKCLEDSYFQKLIPPITAAARSETWNAFACSNTGIVGSNTTRGMHMCLLFLFMLMSYVDDGLVTWLISRPRSPTSCP
jgi:hypothetical protein